MYIVLGVLPDGTKDILRIYFGRLVGEHCPRPHYTASAQVALVDPVIQLFVANLKGEPVAADTRR
jgi:hypothetical protein